MNSKVLPLPNEIIYKIFEYDCTNKNKFDNCIIELKEFYKRIIFYWKKGYKFRLK